MALDRTAYNALIDDDGSNTVGTLWTKNIVKTVLLDPMDVALAAVAPVGTPIRQVVAASMSGDFSTSSTSLVDVTNATITVTTGAGAAVLLFCTIPARIASGTAYFDWNLDGVDGGAIQGVVSSSTITTLSLAKLFLGLTAAAHVFKLRVRSSGGGAIACDMTSFMNGSMSAVEFR
jgi:hypothetical protein